MRVKKYFKLDTLKHETLEEEFNKEHYHFLGIPATPVYGMHQLNALQLINYWNLQSAKFNKGRWFYYVEA